MRKEELMGLVEERVGELMARLAQKQAEYAEDEDALAQFERAGVLQGCGPEMALLGMVSKHIVALYDLARVEKLAGLRFGKRWEEYTGDIVVYMLILGAMVDFKFAWAIRPEIKPQATQGMGKKGKR